MFERLIAGSPPTPTWPGSTYLAYNLALRRARVVWQLTWVVTGGSYVVGLGVAAFTAWPLAVCALAVPVPTFVVGAVWLRRWRQRYYGVQLVLDLATKQSIALWSSVGIDPAPTTAEAAMAALAPLQPSDTVTFLRGSVRRGAGADLAEQQAALAAWSPTEPVAVARKARVAAAVAFDRSGSADLSTAEDLGHGLVDPGERGNAAVAVTMEAAREAILRGDDWTRPLRAAAQTIGPLAELTRSRRSQVRSALISVVLSGALIFALIGPSGVAGLFDFGWLIRDLRELNGSAQSYAVAYNNGFLAQQGRALASPEEATNANAISLLTAALPHATPVGTQLSEAALQSAEAQAAVVFDWDGAFGFPTPPGLTGPVVRVDLLAGSYLSTGATDVIVYLDPLVGAAPGTGDRGYRYSLDPVTYAQLVDLLLPTIPGPTL